MGPKRFLSIIGPFLIVMGILGLTGLLGRISPASFFHPPVWIDWVHLSLGIVVTIAAWKGTPHQQMIVTLFPACIGIVIGAVGLLFGSALADRYGLPELADPSDHIAHLTVGILATWAFLEARRRRLTHAFGNHP